MPAATRLAFTMARVYQKVRKDRFKSVTEAAGTYPSYLQSPGRKGGVHTSLHARNFAPAGRALVVAAALLLTGTTARAEDTPPPRDLLREIAANGSRFEEEFQKYTYRQRFFFSELGGRGATAGFYREVRDIVFTPAGERTEKLVKRPVNTLKRMRLTEEDFRDIREVQPFVLGRCVAVPHSGGIAKPRGDKRQRLELSIHL